MVLDAAHSLACGIPIEAEKILTGAVRGAHAWDALLLDNSNFLGVLVVAVIDSRSVATPAEAFSSSVVGAAVCRVCHIYLKLKRRGAYAYAEGKRFRSIHRHFARRPP